MSSHKEIFTRRPQQDESHMRPPYYLLWTRKKAWKTGNGCNSPINAGSETYKLKFNSLICDFGQITCPLWISTSLFGGVWVITYRTQRLRGLGGWWEAVVWLELGAGDARLGLKTKESLNGQKWRMKGRGWELESHGSCGSCFSSKGRDDLTMPLFLPVSLPPVSPTGQTYSGTSCKGAWEM